MSEGFSKLLLGVNVLPLQAALLRQPWLFGQHRGRAEAYKSPHKSMTDIWVRYNALENFDPENPRNFNNEHDSVWYPAFYSLPQIREIIFPLMHAVEGERLGGVLITKLAPGGRIDRHVDAGWHAEYYDKFYVPILNDAGAVFGWDDGVIAPALGDVYWFRNDLPHWVENNSARERIALIVCIRTHKYKEP